MARRSGKGMNKEKLICCCAIALLAACALLISAAQAWPQATVLCAYQGLFGSVPPAPLANQAPLTLTPPPPRYQVAGPPIWHEPENTSRATPFAPMPDPQDVANHGGGNAGETDVGRNDRGDAPHIPMAGPKPVRQPIRPSPLDDPSLVAYMGVLGLRGQRYGMLRVKDGEFRNVREGDELTDLGCTIVRVEKESIHLLTRNGVYHILRKTGS